MAIRLIHVFCTDSECKLILNPNLTGIIFLFVSDIILGHSSTLLSKMPQESRNPFPPSATAAGKGQPGASGPAGSEKSATSKNGGPNFYGTGAPGGSGPTFSGQPGKNGPTFSQAGGNYTGGGPTFTGLSNSKAGTPSFNGTAGASNYGNVVGAAGTTANFNGMSEANNYGGGAGQYGGMAIPGNQNIKGMSASAYPGGQNYGAMQGGSGGPTFSGMPTFSGAGGAYKQGGDSAATQPAKKVSSTTSPPAFICFTAVKVSCSEICANLIWFQ